MCKGLCLDLIDVAPVRIICEVEAEGPENLRTRANARAGQVGLDFWIYHLKRLACSAYLMAQLIRMHYGVCGVRYWFRT
jgi:hypothetical protein